VNIVMVSPYLGPVLGGIEKDMLCLAREFISQGDRVAFVTTCDEFPEGRVNLSQALTYELPASLQVVRLEGHFRSHLRHFHPANPPLWLPGLAHTVLRLGPDVVIFFNIGWPLTVLPALLGLRRHSIVLYQTAYHAPLDHHLLDSWRSRLQLGVASLSHQLLPHSHHEKQQIMQDGCISEEKITVAYPGVDVWDLGRDEVEGFCARYDLVNRIVISHVGRLSAFQGTDKLIRALPELRRRSGRDVVLLLVGRNLEAESLNRLVAELGVNDWVRFTGPVAERDLHIAYAASDVFALPSTYESFGFVFLEAMAHGVPVIGVRTGGVPEVIRDGETGFILDSSQDVDGLADMLVRLIEDDALRARLGGQAREWVRRQFNWAKAAETVKSIVRGLN
jgi:glycosyltransferase involved in cell wall biosynthesis